MNVIRESGDYKYIMDLDAKKKKNRFETTTYILSVH